MSEPQAVPELVEHRLADPPLQRCPTWRLALGGPARHEDRATSRGSDARNTPDDSSVTHRRDLDRSERHHAPRVGPRASLRRIEQRFGPIAPALRTPGLARQLDRRLDAHPEPEPLQAPRRRGRLRRLDRTDRNERHQPLRLGARGGNGQNRQGDQAARSPRVPHGARPAACARPGLAAARALPPPSSRPASATTNFSSDRCSGRAIPKRSAA